MEEKTLLLIKPNATARNKIGAILSMVESNGFTIEELKLFRMNGDLADRFYAEHVGKDFYPELKRFMMSGRIVGAILKREEAVVKLRELVGNTDSAKAALGTIRSLYGQSKGENAVHASDSPESAAREIALIFT
ncbi:MAG: nucleoside-diphosphate kinase [Candidatus Cloacimonetes bacterium]|nr:nucleoside-diphosphate kinase [Candidatus Cloacimonadota bacterium]